MSVAYSPTITLNKFHRSDKVARFIIGPLGSGKSFAMIMELLRRAVTQEPDSHNIRPTRFAIIRNTSAQIRDTCLADIQALFKEAGIMTYRVSDSRITMAFFLGDGTKVESDWLLIPIERREDTRKLLSLQLTGAWASEFRELDYSIIAAVMGRIGRYPSRARITPTWRGLIAESNPFSEGSDWYKNLVMELPEDWDFWQQPGGLSEDAENIANLDGDYYARLMNGTDEEWQKVHVHGQFGDDLSGQAVWGRAFNYKYHTKSGLQTNPELPLMVAMDLGRTPTALITQIDNFGRLLVIKEITSVDMGLHTFMGQLLIPTLAEDQFRTSSRYIVADPAGRQKSQISEESAFDVFRSHGFTAHPATTNDISPRLRAVESLLLQNRGDGAALVMDKDNCPQLIAACRHNYKYARKKTGVLDDKPEKLHPWSDLADALQYASLAVSANLPGRVSMYNTSRSKDAKPRVGARGWT